MHYGLEKKEQYEMHISRLFPYKNWGVSFEEVFTSLQTVHGVVFKESIVNTFGVSHEAMSSPFPSLTVSEPQTFSSVVVCHSYHLGAFSLLSGFTQGKAFYMCCRMQKKSCSLCCKGRYVYVCQWQSMKIKLFSCLTNNSLFLDKGEVRSWDWCLRFRVLQIFKK